MTRTWIERNGAKCEVKLERLVCPEKRQRIYRVDYVNGMETEYMTMCIIAGGGDVRNYFHTLREARHYTMKEGREIVELDKQDILEQMYG